MRKIGSHFLTLLFSIGCLMPTVSASAEPTRLIINLADGSRVIGQTDLPALAVESAALGQLQIPLAKIRHLKFDADRTTASVLLANGDKLAGRLTFTGLKLTTIFGTPTISRELITEVQVTGPLGSLPANGLVLYLAFDDNDAAVTTDQSPSALRAEIHGAQRDPAGWSGNALRINGTGDYAIIQDEPVLNRLERAATIAAWIKIDPDAEFSEAGNPHILSKGATYAHLYSDFALHLTGDNGAFTWEYSNNQNRPAYAKANGIARNEWRHIAATFQDGAVTLFLDGRAVGTETGAAKTLRTSTQPLYIGCRYLSPYTMPFKGLIDEVRIYNRALSDSEVQSLAAPAKPTR